MGVKSLRGYSYRDVGSEGRGRARRSAAVVLPEKNAAITGTHDTMQRVCAGARSKAHHRRGVKNQAPRFFPPGGR